MDTVVQAAGDGDIELSGQVGVLPVADKHFGEFAGDGRRIQQLAGREAGNRAPNHCANVVHAGLQRDQSHAVQTFPDFGYVVDAELAQLHLLTSGQVAKALPVVIADIGQNAELIGVAEAVGHAYSHHKTARGLPTEKHAGPLQAIPLLLRYGLPTGGGIVGNIS